MKRLSLLLLVSVWGQLMLTADAGTSDDFSEIRKQLPVTSAEDEPTLEPIPGTNNYRLNGKKSKDERPWFIGSDPEHCVRSAKCETIKNQTCFGSKVPYNFTSVSLTDVFNQETVRERMLAYEALRNVPRCWAVIQPFLCAVFVPRCERIAGADMVYLPTLEQCRITQEPCRLVYDTPFFPEFLRCNETLFPTKCKNDVREIKFNTTGTCVPPLVATDSSAAYYEDIEGCSVQCRDPLYTDDEHQKIHSLNFWCATACLVCNALAIASFLIDWKNANKYPAVIIFYINVCFLINCLAWLVQFRQDNREDIVCRKDGTLRHSEPSSGDNLSCIAVFVSIYYTLLAVMVWFVILTYSWHLRTIANGVPHRIDKKSSYFHLIAWSLPLILTIATMALSEVDGNSIAGICFVGYLNHPIRAGFLLGPLCGVLLCGGFFIGRGMFKLFAVKRIASEVNALKIHAIIIRMGISAAFAFVFVVVVIMCQVYEFRYAAQWAQSLRRLIICKITSSFSDVHQTCNLESRPNVAVLQLQLYCLFFTGIVMSSWCWTHQTLGAWKRYIKKKLGIADDDSATKLRKQKPKSKIVAQIYAKRKEFQETGRTSVSFFEAHPDPAGLNFDIDDMNSAATNEMSTTWCDFLPKLICRRQAIAISATSAAGPRKSSVDSEFSIRMVSVESRRNSVDSQVSVKIAKVQTKVMNRAGQHTSATTAKAHHRHHRHHHSTSKHIQQHPRRNSSTSIESQIITSSAYVKDKRMRRRSANAGLDAADLDSFIKRNFQGMVTTSDDDNASRTSLTIQDSLDVMVRQNGHHGRNDDDADSDDRVMVPRRQTPMSQEEMLDDVRRRYPELGDLMTIRSVADYAGNTLQRSPPTTGHSDRVVARKVARTGSQKKKRRGTKSRGTKAVRNQTTTAMALMGVDAHRQVATNGLGSDSFSSNSSAFVLPIAPINGTQSSYSGMSVGKHSRSSKTSCDVGTQANAHEIATQTMSYGESNDGLLTAIASVEQASATRAIMAMGQRRDDSSESSDDDAADSGDRYVESHRLLSGVVATTRMVSAPAPSSTSAASMAKLMMSSATKRREVAASHQGRRSEVTLSESEKLRMLLLPSK